MINIQIAMDNSAELGQEPRWGAILNEVCALDPNVPEHNKLLQDIVSFDGELQLIENDDALPHKYVNK